jgi:hypothetical protein
MSVERLLSNQADRVTMHRMIDELPEGGFAILCCYAPRGAEEGAAESWWRVYSHPSYLRALGLLEMVKASIINDHFAPQKEADE